MVETLQVKVVAIITTLLVSWCVGQVWAEGYEVETVGGILNPTNLMMTVAEAVFLGIVMFAVVLAIAFIRVEKTGKDKPHKT